MTQHNDESPDLLVGQTIDNDRYELLRVIGEGGTGRVYEARQKRVHRLVAIKVLHAHWAQDTKSILK